MKKILLIAALLVGCKLHADQLKVAVASNFEPTMQQLAVTIKETTGIEITVISGSTGQLYAQIKHGAPFDVFMAADTIRPQLLVADGSATDYLVYAQGRLVIIANQSDCNGVLIDPQLDYVALADPALAPYGLAAKQYLQSIDQWNHSQTKLVIGTNAAQALHMVFSGNAKVGLVAESLLVNQKHAEGICQKPVPVNRHQPIEQAMVFLKRSHKKDQFTAFKQFIQSETAQKLMANNGYSVDFLP